MQRTSGDGFEPDGNGAGKDGFKDTGPNPTTVDAAWLNDMQENVAGYIESRGLTLIPDDFTQLQDAIETHFPASSTDNRVARFHLATGKIIQESAVSIADTGDVSGVVALAMTGALSGATTIASTGDITAGDDVIATGDFEYATPPSRVSYFSALDAMSPSATGAAGITISTDGRATVGLSAGFIMWDLASLLPRGAVVTLVRALVAPATVQAGANRSGVQVETIFNDFTTPTNNPVAGSGATVGYDNGTNTNYQVVTTGTVSITIALYTVVIATAFADTGAGGGPVARLNGIEVTWTDPGPRNF